MNGDSSSRGNSGGKGAIRHRDPERNEYETRLLRSKLDDVRGTGTPPIRQLPTDHIAVRSVWQRRVERRRPLGVFVVDGDKPKRPCTISVSKRLPVRKWNGVGHTTTERDLLRSWSAPVGDLRVPNGVAETDHAGDGLPTMLAEPAVGTAVARACTRSAIGGTSVGARETVA